MGPSICFAFFGCQGEGDNRYIINSFTDNQRFGNAFRQACNIGTNFFMHPNNGDIFIGSDIKTGSDHHLIIFGLRINMLNAANAFDYILKRLRDELHRIFSLKAIGRD